MARYDDSSNTALAPRKGSDLSSPRQGAGYSPWDLMEQMQNDLSRMFGQSVLAPFRPGSLAREWSPNVDLSETDQEYQLEVDLPGVDRKDIDIQVQDHQLQISAKLNQSQEDQGNRQYYRRERRSGYFQEVLPLPANVDENAIRADFNNGVLILHIPKSQKLPQGRRVEIGDNPQGAQPNQQGNKDNTNQ